MGGDARFSFPWADGVHVFRLGIGEIRELQDVTGVGPHALLKRIMAGEWRVDDLRETIRLGLIGGGMEPAKALPLVIRYVENRPLLESVRPALAVLSAVLSGFAETPVGKPKAKRKKTAAGSASPTSSASAP